jgi:Tat protein secretion system quality control protein TatD with DNase activity
VNEVVKKIAEIKGESLEKVQKQLVENARHLFGV